MFNISCAFFLSFFFSFLPHPNPCAPLPLQRIEDSPETGKGSIRLNIRIFTRDETPKTLAISVSDTTRAVIAKAIEQFAIINEQAEKYTFLMTVGSEGTAPFLLSDVVLVNNNFLLAVIDRVLTFEECPLAIKFTLREQDRQADPIFLIVSSKFLDDKVEEEKARRESLLSAVTEKINRRVYQTRAMVSLEVDQLVMENTDLKGRDARLQSGMDQLRNAGVRPSLPFLYLSLLFEFLS